MLKLTLISIFSFLICPGAQASSEIIKAGADSSGGGKAVVCRDSSNGKISSIEMLDLYEARAMYGLEPLPMGATYDEALETVKARLLYAAVFGQSISFGIDRLKTRLRILPPGSRLEPVDDASPIALPEGCKLEQAAVWVDKNLVVVDRELWEAMDVRNHAALAAHEVVYDITRGEGEKNSRRARKIVGHAFSKFHFGGVREGVPEKVRYCSTKTEKLSQGSGFWMYPGKDGMLTMQFLALRGSFVVGTTKVEFKQIRFNPAPDESIAEAQEISSTFETTRAMLVISDPTKPEGKRLAIVEWTDLGKSETLYLNCREM